MIRARSERDIARSGHSRETGIAAAGNRQSWFGQASDD